MAKILILGGSGYTGRLLAGHLLERTGAGIVLAARRQDRLQALADELNGRFGPGRVSTVQADATEPESLRRALHGATLILVAAPTTAQAGTVVRAALEAGVDYLDVQLGAQKLALLQSLAGEIQASGRCFITEAGFHPGLPAALVRCAAARLESVESAVTAGYLNMGRSLPYSEAVDELMQAFEEYQAQVFKDGAWTKPGAFDMRRIDFEGDIGKRRCYSMFFEELRPLPGMYPGLRETGFYMAETHWFSDNVLTLLVMAGLKLFGKRAYRPLGRLMWWGMQNLPRPPHRVELLARTTGLKDGRPASVLVRVAHPDGYELTAIPVVAALMQVLDGSARKPGLWMMGHLVDPLRLLDDMQAMGVQVSIEEER